MPFPSNYIYRLGDDLSGGLSNVYHIQCNLGTFFIIPSVESKTKADFENEITWKLLGASGMPCPKNTYKQTDKQTDLVLEVATWTEALEWNKNQNQKTKRV